METLQPRDDDIQFKYSLTLERLQFDHQLDNVIISIWTDLFPSTDLDPYYYSPENGEVHP